MSRIKTRPRTLRFCEKGGGNPPPPYSMFVVAGLAQVCVSLAEVECDMAQH